MSWMFEWYVVMICSMCAWVLAVALSMMESSNVEYRACG